MVRVNNDEAHGRRFYKKSVVFHVSDYLVLNAAGLTSLNVCFVCNEAYGYAVTFNFIDRQKVRSGIFYNKSIVSGNVQVVVDTLAFVVNNGLAVDHVDRTAVELVSEVICNDQRIVDELRLIISKRIGV